MRKGLFYLLIIGGPILWGVYGALYVENAPTQNMVAVLVLYCAVVGLIRNLSVGNTAIDFSFSIKEKLARAKRAWLGR